MRWLACVTTCVLLGGSGLVVGAMAVETWTVGGQGPHAGAVRILDTGTGPKVIRVDLSALPAGAKVYRARLFVRRKAPSSKVPEALARNEIHLLTAPFRQGKRMLRAGKPLAIAPPAHDCFDATAAVRARAGETCDFLVTSLPPWTAQSTRVEVAYEGKVKGSPVQVVGLRVFHRAGQTFITWKEVRPLVTSETAAWGEIRRKLTDADGAIQYQLYAHTSPINAKTISNAQLVARVGPLSGYNCNGRNMEYLIAQAMLKPDEMGELARDYNGHMYTWGMDSARMDRYPVRRFVVDVKDGPLPAGTGLYVHHPTRPGRRYYAAVSCKDGRANTADFSPANALAQPVAETVGPGEPVHQGPGLWGPYFDYPGRRQTYVQWCAPPLCPRPSMYFNWSILVPPGMKQGSKAPVELYFHSGNFSYAKPRKKYLLNSIQIAPHDYPFSGWYGFNSAWGTLRSFRNGVVNNHTQKRIIAFLNWAEGRFPLDESRIVLPGADGAACLALNYRDVFACVLIQGFGGQGKVERQGRILDPKQAPLFASAWGPKSPAIKDDKGRPQWGWAMLDQLALADPATAIPLMTCRGTSWGGKRFYGSGFGTFYTNMQTAHQPVIGGHGWDCKLITPDWYTGRWRGLDLTNKTPVMAFANSATSRMKLQSGNTNFYHQWKDVVDEKARFSVFLSGGVRADVTPRRLQNFRPEPGARLRWETSPVASRGDKTPPKPAEGTVTVGRYGVFTIKQVQTPPGGTVLTVTLVN